MPLLVTFGIEEPSSRSGCAVSTLVRVPRHALFTCASHHLKVLRQFSHGAHRLDANDPQVLMVADVQSTVQRAHYHVVLVLHVWDAGK